MPFHFPRPAGFFCRAMSRRVRTAWFPLASVAALLFAPTAVHAATRTWADVGTDFATAANWGGTAPANNITNDIGSFNSVLNFQPVLSANRSINGLAFTALATGTVTLSGAGTLTTGTGGINNASTTGQKSINTALILGAAQSFTNNGSLGIAGSTLTNGGFLLTLTGTGAGGALSSNVSGTGGITKTGTGTWVVSGNNSGYSGTTTVSAGTLRATNGSALGTGALSLGAGTLQLANDNPTSFGNNTTLTGAATINSDVATVGGAGVTHTLGTLTTGANTLNITTGGNVGSGLAGVTFGNTTVSGNATFNTGNNTVLTLGALTDSAARTITKSGAGTLILNAAAGTWTNNSNLVVNNGTVRLNASNALGSGAALTNVTVNSNTVGSLTYFDLNGFNQTVLSLTFGGAGATTTSTNIVTTNGGTLTLGGNVTYTATNNPLGAYLIGQVDLGAASRTFTIGDSTSAPYDLIVSADISSLSGAFGLTKAGAGTMVLSGNNSYTGGTTVSAGVLNIQSNTALGTSAAGTTVASGAALQLQGGLTITGEPLTLSGTGIANTGAVRNISDNNIWTGALTLNANTQFQSDAGLLTFSGTITGATRTITVSGAGDMAFTNTVALTTGGLIMNGTGTLTLAGTNTYTGTTTINSGTVSVNTLANLSTASALGAPTTAANGTIAIGATTVGGTLQYTGSGNSSTNRVVNLAGTTGGATLDASGAGSLTFTSNFTATGAGSKTLNLVGSSTASNAISGAIVNNSGTNLTSLFKDGAGTWILSGANTYTGTTTLNNGILRATTSANALGGGGLILNGGTLSLANNAGLNFARNTTVTGSTTLESDVLTLGNAGVTHTLGTLSIGSQQLNLTKGANVGSGTAGVTFGATTLTGDATFDRANGTLLTLGALNDGGTARNVTLQDTGATTLGSAATSLVDGTTVNVTDGTLNSNNATALGTLANVNLSGGTTVNLGATGQTFGALNGASTNTVNLGTNNLTVGNATNNLSSIYSGNLTGSGTLTKAGSGTFTLGGNNSGYTGAVNINAGTVVAQAATVFNSANVLTVASGATLNLNDYNAAIASLNNSGTVQLGTGGAQILTLSSGSSFLQTGGSFAGVGTIVINAGATLTLNAAFNNSGINVILNGGTLNLNGTAGSLSNIIGSLTINANSVLDFGSSVATSLTANSVSFGTTLLTLTVNNWVNAVDYFYSLSTPDPSGNGAGSAPLNQFNFTGGSYTNNDTKWLPYDHQITPAPEPAVYGAVLAGCSTLLLAWRRRRAV